jgi:RNA polymerase sigma-70 factor (sigma-E family)
MSGSVGLADQRFAEFFRIRRASAARAAYLLVGDKHAAEELAQEGMVRLYAAWPRLRSEEAAVAYLNKTMFREYLRAKNRHRTTGDDFLPDRPAPVVGDKELRMDLARLLETLPSRQRATIVLRYYLDLPVDEVARVLGCTTGTVKSQTSKALASLERVTRVESWNAGDEDEHGRGVYPFTA